MNTLLKQILNLGIDTNTSQEESLKIRLFNQINLSVFLAGSISIILNVILKQYEIIPIGILVVSALGTPLYLSYRQRFMLARQLLLFVLGLAVLITAYMGGTLVQTYFILFLGLLLTVIIFTDRFNQLLFSAYFSLLIFVCFWLSIKKAPIIDIPHPEIITFGLIVISTIGLFVILGSYREMLKNQNNIIKSYQKSLEDVVHERTERLEESLKELKQSNQDLEEFAYAASHDLQEPLRMIRNFSQLIERKLGSQFDDDTRTYMHFIQDSVLRMSELIKGLLDFSRVGRKEVQLIPTNIQSLIQDKLQDFRQLIEEKNARIEFSPLPEHMVCEPQQLSLLFTNLIHNGLKFNESEIPIIKISAVEEKNHWRFEVADNGIGIQQDYQKQVFEIFRRLHLRDKYDGTGIGLALCRKIAERHGGEIWMSSEPEHGTSMFFRVSKSLTPSQNASPPLLV
ncbi:MAG: ATP-binding protein [Bacteroidia bacterium]